jgi:acyl dehydratase
MTIDPACKGSEHGPVSQAYDWRDVALYAIGLGAGTADLGYLLEDPPPKVLPTFAVIPAFPPVFDLLRTTGGNLVTLLHSSQRVELIRPFPAQGTLETTSVVRGVWDMKIGALTIIDTETAVDGKPTARTSWQLLLRGEGGFGGERPPKLLHTRPPKDRDPDFRAVVPTAENQALLYRLSGDINPIHARPEVAQEAGFGRPILHGLCFYGIAGRAALRELAGDDPTRFRALEARFAKVVMPGDTLIVEGFLLEDPGRAAFTVTVEESGDRAIANGLFEFAP